MLPPGSAAATALGDSRIALSRAHDVVMLDLDGVVYVGGAAVPGAVESLGRAYAEHLRLAFITNNAARPPAAVAAHLSTLGIAASSEDVVTSAQAAARVLQDRLDSGAPVATLGAAGLTQAVSAVGLVPVGIEDEAVALVTGYGPEVLWKDVMRAAVRIRDGLWWVASNTDLTIPTPYGSAPGHGVLVETLRRFAGIEPVVAGKPSRPLLDETVRRTGARRPLMVGDRLDTDIEGARSLGIDSLLVLTGVTGLAELTAAPPDQRPTYIAPDLAGLHAAHSVPGVEEGRTVLGGWRAQVRDGCLEIDGAGTADDWWRVAAVAGWRHLDDSGTPARVDGLTAPGSPAADPDSR